jgi:branched-chain amino acid transport system permease protein
VLAYLVNLTTLVAINVILAVTLNFVIGYAGIFSMAHAAFFGIGAYTAAFVAMRLTDDFAVCVIAAMALTGFVSVLLALPALRVRGEYFVAASLGLQILATTVFTEWKSVTGGIGGVVGIPSPKIFGYPILTATQVMVLSLVCLAITLAIIAALVRSAFGRNLKAIRDSESAASAFGKHVAVIKTLSVVVSSSLAAVAGALYSFHLSFINVESFTLDTSVLLMGMVIIGGAGTLSGPVIGAVLLMILPSALSYLWFLPPTEIGSIQQIIYGLAMVLLMIFRPGGLASSGVPNAADTAPVSVASAQAGLGR